MPGFVVRNTKKVYLAALFFGSLSVFYLYRVSSGKEIIFFLLPLPFIILSALAPYPTIAVNLVGGLIICKWLGMGEALGFISGAAACSWVVGCLMRRSLPAFRVIFAGVILAALGMNIFFLTAGRGYLAEHQKNFDHTLSYVISSYRERGIEEDKLVLFQEAMQVFNKFFLLAFPAIIVIMAAALVSFHYLLARRILAGLGYSFSPLPPISYWKIPDGFIWVFIAGGFSIWLGKILALDEVYRAGLNFMCVAIVAYLIQGGILLKFFLKKWGWPVVLEVLLYLFLLLQPVFLIIVFLLGMFEVWVDFRKLKGNETSTV